LYYFSASSSAATSSTKAAAMASFKSVIFPMTESKVYSEKVEATYNKAAIGLDFPILANSTKAPSTEVGTMVPNLSMINSIAAMTPGPYSYLAMKSFLSYSLAKVN